MNTQSRSLSRTELLALVEAWLAAWSRHDLRGILECMTLDTRFENWNGVTAKGHVELARAWQQWFDSDPDFRFSTEEIFADEQAQKVTLRWSLRWKSREPKHLGKTEVRRGVDIIHIEGGLIAATFSYSRTTILIDDRRVRLTS